MVGLGSAKTAVTIVIVRVFASGKNSIPLQEKYCLILVK